MSLKLKISSLSLVAVLAVSGVAATNASAFEGGHFTSPMAHTHITGSAGGAFSTHDLHFVNHGLSGEVGCSIQSYEGTMFSETVTSLTITPSYAGCSTTGTGQSTPIDVNGCTYTFTVSAFTDDSTEQTAHLNCPLGFSVNITHPNCTISIHPQTVNSGITYTRTVGESGAHEITVDLNAQLSTTRHGLCQFVVPTNGTATLKGSLTVKGFETVGNQRGITAT